LFNPLASKDLELSDTLIKEGQERNDLLVGEDLKRRYILSRAVEKYPDLPTPAQHYADYLVERPDEYEGWNLAEELYQKAIKLSGTKRFKKHRKLNKELVFAVYRAASFYSYNRKNYEIADGYFKKLLQLLQGWNSWAFERYAEFLVECKHKYAFAERLYRMVLNIAPTGSIVSSFGIFLWHVLRNYNLALKCFSTASELDLEKIYFYTNFLGRHTKDEVSAKNVLESSGLYQHVKVDPDEKSVFSLALAYHQIHCVDEAEELYRKHLEQTQYKSIFTLSNLAELLLHSRRNFKEAEELYKRGLTITAGANDTIQVAMAGLKLAQNDLEEGLPQMERLMNASHIRCSQNVLTEAHLIYFIHCPAEKKLETLTTIKTQLVSHLVRPKLILMFDANIDWARQHLSHEEVEWISLLCSVYNCEEEIEVLDGWDMWDSIDVPFLEDDWVPENIYFELFGDKPLIDEEDEASEEEEGQIENATQV